MTKPPLGKVEALLYVLQHVTKRGCARILTHPQGEWTEYRDFIKLVLLQAIEVAEGDGNAHGVGTREDIHLVVGENIGQPIIETTLKKQ